MGAGFALALHDIGVIGSSTDSYAALFFALPQQRIKIQQDRPQSLYANQAQRQCSQKRRLARAIVAQDYVPPFGFTAWGQAPVQRPHRPDVFDVYFLNFHRREAKNGRLAQAKNA